MHDEAGRFRKARNRNKFPSPDISDAAFDPALDIPFFVDNAILCL